MIDCDPKSNLAACDIHFARFSYRQKAPWQRCGEACYRKSARRDLRTVKTASIFPFCICSGQEARTGAYWEQ
jgi:hypothetical protein